MADDIIWDYVEDYMAERISKDERENAETDYI